jgi:hypothetical protein
MSLIISKRLLTNVILLNRNIKQFSTCSQNRTGLISPVTIEDKLKFTENKLKDREYKLKIAREKLKSKTSSCGSVFDFIDVVCAVAEVGYWTVATTVNVAKSV